MHATAALAAPTLPNFDAVGQMLNRHRERLVRFVSRRIGDADEAEDLAQQALAEAARGMSQFRGESQLSTWLFAIAMNLVRQHWARAPQRARLVLDDEEVESASPADEADPEHRVAMAQLVRLLEREMDGLMPEMREVLLLVTMDELSYEDAAERLQVPVGTVRSRVSRARSHLRRRMGAAGAHLPF